MSSFINQQAKGLACRVSANIPRLGTCWSVKDVLSGFIVHVLELTIHLQRKRNTTFYVHHVSNEILFHIPIIFVLALYCFVYKTALSVLYLCVFVGA